MVFEQFRVDNTRFYSLHILLKPYLKSLNSSFLIILNWDTYKKFQRSTAPQPTNRPHTPYTIPDDQ